MRVMLLRVNISVRRHWIANSVILSFGISAILLALHLHSKAMSLTAKNTADAKLQTTEKLSVDDGRPLAEAILLLESKFGSVITYEDPAYVYSGDISDVTESVRRDLDKFEPGKAPRVLVPKGGKFDFVVIHHANGTGDEGRTLEKLVSDYGLVARSSRFRIERARDAFHVIPVLVRNAAGRLTPQAPVLDARITFSTKERTGFQEIQDFCAEVSRVTRKQVVMGNVPNRFAGYKDNYGIPTTTNARVALAQILKRLESGRRLSWRLLYDPGMKIFVLNIHSVG